MKKLFLTSVAALFLATGTAYSQNTPNSNPPITFAYNWYPWQQYTDPIVRLMDAYEAFIFINLCHQARQGYLVVWINDVEFSRAKTVGKIIEIAALSKQPDLNTDDIWQKSIAAFNQHRNDSRFSGFNRYTCQSTLERLYKISPKPIYQVEKP